MRTDAARLAIVPTLKPIKTMYFISPRDRKVYKREIGPSGKEMTWKNRVAFVGRYNLISDSEKKSSI